MAVDTCQWLLSAYQEMIAFRILRSLFSFATEKTSWFDTSVQWRRLRSPVLGQDLSQTKKIGLGLDFPRCGLGLGLAGLVLCCETWSCYGRHQNDLEIRHSSFSSTIYYFFILCLESLLWISTAVFTYLKVKSAKCLYLLPVVLVLLFWSWY